MFLKRFFLTALFVLMALSHLQSQTLKIASYNIRLDTKADSLNPWKDRKYVVCDLIRFHDFDIFGTQEVLYNQLEDLKAGLKGYSYIGKGRTDGKLAGEFSAIFYKKDMFDLLKEGTFWLSDTNTETSNKGWDAALPRICTWGLFKDKKSGAEFYLFNTHFDHKGVVARRESAKLILAKIKEMAGKTSVVLTGDFNFDQNNESHALINNSGVLKDSYETAEIKLANNGTFNGFNIKSATNKRIDFIFTSKNIDVMRFGILTDSYQAKLPSDHYPIVIEAKLKK